MNDTTPAVDGTTDTGETQLDIALGRLMREGTSGEPQAMEATFNAAL
jgi:hypothetical protein